MPAACLNCVQKHLEQAMVIHEEEVPMGYPQHIRRVRGHLAEASRESVNLYPELANVIREHRLELVVRTDHLPPYDKLLDLVELLMVCEAQKLPIPQIPDELRVQKKEAVSETVTTPELELMHV